MKTAFFIVLYFFISETNSLTLQQIQGVDSIIRAVNFDLDGNTYAGLNNFGDRHELYKISPSKEILWKIDYPAELGSITNILVTSQNQLYLSFFSLDQGKYPIAILQPGSTELVVVEPDFSDFVFIIEKNDDLIYSKDDGIHILKPNSTTSIRVKNLENVSIYESRAVDIDKSGNVYLGMNSGKLAVISSEAQQEEIPSAAFVNDSDPILKFMQDIAIDSNDNLWTVTSNAFTATFKKLINNVLEIVATDESKDLHELIPAKDKIFVISYSPLNDEKTGTIYYLTSNGEIVKIPELENVSFGELDGAGGAADSEGNAYFHPIEGVFSESLGLMVRVNSDNGSITPIELNIKDWNIPFIKIDFNEDVWIKLTDKTFRSHAMYYLKKGETVAEKVNIVGTGCNFSIDDIDVNWVTKEIFVSCIDGLYVVADD